MVILLFIIGACVGSFLGALTWRWPREIAVSSGRSKCPHCNHTIRWHDNIPIVSYLALVGRCRDCKDKIPRRDFAIEIGTAFLFPIAYSLLPSVLANVSWLMNFPKIVSLVVVLVVLSISVAIFVIDMEHQYIPDTLVFILLGGFIALFLLSDNTMLFKHLAAGAGAALFLLVIHLATLGRGMGLGDVKLAFALGAFLGFPLSVVWMFLSFIIGSIAGIILIIFKLAKLKQKIAFGPFLVVAFFLTVSFGFELLNRFYLFY